MALRVALVGGPMYDGLYSMLEGATSRSSCTPIIRP